MALVLILTAAFAVPGCLPARQPPASVSPAVPTVSATAVFLAGSGSLEGASLSVEGTGTVPDGSVLSWLAGRYRPDGYLGVVRSGSTTVTSDRFAFRTRVLGVPADKPDRIVVIVIFSPSTTGQPASVSALYGDSGSLMTGPQVGKVGDRFRAVLTFEVRR